MNAIEERMLKFYSKNDRSVTINACPGHFATSQSHTNFYIDVTRIKMRVSEAEEAAHALCAMIQDRIDSIDTIVCLDGTEMLGGFLGRQIEKGNFHMTNRHETMYVVEPEENSIHQFLFRINNRMAIEGKNVLILVDTTSTGETLKRVIECVRYYGGKPVGCAAIFSTIDSILDQKIYSLFSADDMPEYQVYEPQDCPFCAKKIPIDALVNGYGYAKL